MEKIQAWFKAHWKPFAIAFVAGVAVWFLFLRKNSSGASILSIPPVTGGGGAGGAGSSATDAGAPPAPPAAPAAPPSFFDWFKQAASSSFLPNGRSFLQWERDLVATYTQQTGQQAQELPGPNGTTGLLTGPSVPAYSWFQRQYALAGQALPGPQGTTPTDKRGSGFRGGDIIPSAWGDSRPAAARAAVAANLPAAPLGTSVAPKDALEMDVRRAPRRQTSIAQIARGNPPPTMPQSFSVPVREHLEGSRPVLTVQATNPENEDAANPPSPNTPVATQAELASSDQKATNPAPMAAATPNIARGRKRFGTQRVPARPTQRWK